MDVSGGFFSPLFATIILRSNRTRSRLLVRRVETVGFGIPLFGDRRAYNVLLFRLSSRTTIVI